MRTGRLGFVVLCSMLASCRPPVPAVPPAEAGPPPQPAAPADPPAAPGVAPTVNEPDPVPSPDPAPPEPVPEPVPEPPVVHERCTKIDRGTEQRKHEFFGRTVAELERMGGSVNCGRDPLWQLEFGTHCGDQASFHDVVTVEVRGGHVRRVWVREQYNAAFCGGLE